MFVCVCVCVSLFVTYGHPNRWTKWAEIWHGGGSGPWDSLWMGVTQSCAPRVGVAGKMHTNDFFRQKEVKFGVK